MDQNMDGDMAAAKPLPDRMTSSIEELKEIVLGKRQLYSVEEQLRITNAVNVLEGAVSEIKSSIRQHEKDDYNVRTNCVGFALEICDSNDAARSTLVEMARKYPNSFIPYIREMRRKIEEIADPKRGEDLDAWIDRYEFDEKDYNYNKVVNDVMPYLVSSGDEKVKDAVYHLLSPLVPEMDKKNIPMVWDCLKIAIKEASPAVRSDVFNAYTKLFWRFGSTLGYTKENFASLMHAMEDYYRNNGSNFNRDSSKILFSIYEKFCSKFGKDLVLHLPSIMELVFKMLDLGDEDVLDVMNFEIADENLVPYVPELTSKFKTFLIKQFTGIEGNDFEESGRFVAGVIEKTNFKRLFISIALDLFDESNDHRVRMGFYSMFDNMDELSETEMAEFMPRIVKRMLESVRMSEANAVAKDNMLLVEKLQTIESLKTLASNTDMAFEPYIQSCFDAVQGELSHPDVAVRKVSVEALTEIMVSINRLNKVERYGQLAVKAISNFANMLRADSSSDIACAVFEAFQRLLDESRAVFAEKMELFNEVFNCVSDVMSAKVTCQAGTDFYDKMDVIEKAKTVLLALGKSMRPFEFAVYFNSILPILRERLTSAEQFESEYNDSLQFALQYNWHTSVDSENVKQMPSASCASLFRFWVYDTVIESIRLLQAYTSSSFDTLFPLLLFGTQDKCALARRFAVAGLGGLLSNTREKSNGKSAEVSQVFIKLLVNEQCREVISETCAMIGRLILSRSKLVPVEQFLPLLVEKLKSKQTLPDHHDGMFRCFQMLLDEKNAVLLATLKSIVQIAIRLLPPRGVKNSITEFLRGCRRRFGSVVREVTLNDPQAAKMIKSL